MSIGEQLEDALEAGEVVLLLSSSDAYQDIVVQSVKYLANTIGLPGVYVTVSKPMPTVRNFLTEQDIDTERIFFIDAISKETNADIKDQQDTYYLSSPESLTDISIALSEVMESMPDGEKFMFFDTLSTLTIYHDLNTVSKFSHHVMGKLHGWDVKSVIMSIEQEADDELINHLKQFADTTIEM